MPCSYVQLSRRTNFMVCSNSQGRSFFSVASRISSHHSCLNKCERIVFAKRNDAEEPHEMMKELLSLLPGLAKTQQTPFTHTHTHENAENLSRPAPFEKWKSFVPLTCPVISIEGAALSEDSGPRLIDGGMSREQWRVGRRVGQRAVITPTQSPRLWEASRIQSTPFPLQNGVWEKENEERQWCGCCQRLKVEGKKYVKFAPSRNTVLFVIVAVCASRSPL